MMQPGYDQETADKIRELNLLPMSVGMQAFICESFPFYILNMNSKRFDFVRFYHGKPYFFTLEYVRKLTLDELLTGFAKMVINEIDL